MKIAPWFALVVGFCTPQHPAFAWHEAQPPGTRATCPFLIENLPGILPVGYREIVVVPPDGMRAVNEIYASLPGAPEQTWTFAVLVDGPNRNGSLFVGHDEKICGNINIGAESWEGIKRAIKGHAI